MNEGACVTCGNSADWHNQNPTRHAFNDGTISPTQTFGPRKADGSGKGKPEATPVPAEWPFDPVLRQALIDKGVLTIDDLARAEAKIRMVTNTFVKEAGDGK